MCFAIAQYTVNNCVSCNYWKSSTECRDCRKWIVKHTIGGTKLKRLIYIVNKPVHTHILYICKSKNKLLKWLPYFCISSPPSQCPFLHLHKVKPHQGNIQMQDIFNYMYRKVNITLLMHVSINSPCGDFI